MADIDQIRSFVRKCRASASFFIESSCRIKHTLLGIIPFKLFKYQKSSLSQFRKNRFNIFKKCRQCFAGDAMVWGPDGPKRIDSIQPGNKVYSYDEQSGHLVVATVANAFKNGIRDCVKVTSKTGHSSTTTPDHLFYTYNGAIRAGDLTQDDALVEVNEPPRYVHDSEAILFNRRKGTVKSVAEAGSHEVFDIEVPPHHNYIVDGAVVHNSGISTLTGAYCLWFGMFFSNKKILIVSKRDLDAKEFLHNIQTMYTHLPDWMRQIWRTSSWNEHEVAFTNGSIIRSLTSSPDTLRSNASSLNIIDEAAFMPDMESMWAAGYSCVDATSMVSIDGRLGEIGEIGDVNGPQWQDIDVSIQSDSGIERSDRFYVNGMAPVNKITTSLGYEIICTDNHKLKDINYQWVCSRDLNVRQQLAMKCGSDDSGEWEIPLKSTEHNGRFNPPKVLNKELAELIGYYIGNGSLKRPGRFQLAYNPQDADLPTYFNSYLKSFGLNSLNHKSYRTHELWIDNAHLVEWWQLNGLDSKTRAHDAEIPPLILKAPKSIRAAFLRGLFEANGWNSATRIAGRLRPNIGFSSASSKLTKQVQLVLLDLGIICRKSKSGPWRIQLPNLDEMIKFMSAVGFISRRKNVKRTKQARCGPFKYHIDNGIFYDTIAFIERNEAMTVDVSVPNNNTYVANGFISHNTLQTGGSCVVVSTPRGIGNWYWDKWTEALDGGLFNPILINWWDMDWVIEADDPISNRQIRIAPTDKIRKCTTREDIDKWGPYYSPWLGEQYKGLQARGESHLFRQEILGEFVGSGGTVLRPSALHQTAKSVDNAPQTMTIDEPVTWINQANGDRELLDFSGDSDEGLWVWSAPVTGKSPRYQNGRKISQGIPGHAYVMGIDIATGENNDYSTIEVFDIDAMEQVAEYMGRVDIPLFAKMVDWLGRWYNNAMANPERTGIGAAFIQDLQALLYPNIWRRRKQRTLRPGAAAPAGSYTFAPYGFATIPASKPTLDKALCQYISENEGEGYAIYSVRLLKQLQIYIRHKNRLGFETKRTGAQIGRGNYDDLTIASALAFVAAPDAVRLDPDGLLPTHSKQIGMKTVNTQVSEADAVKAKQEKQKQIMDTRDPHVIIPITFNQLGPRTPTQQEIIDTFARQLITPTEIPVTKEKPKLTMRPRRGHHLNTK